MARIRLAKPDFHISRIKIDNIGAVDSIDLCFDNPAMMALYAGNGLGKTTILECMSLLGHLPCFPTREVGKEAIEPSLAEQAFGSIGVDYKALYGGKFELPKLNENGIEHWVGNRPKRGARYGLVEFHVADTVSSGASAQHRFFLLITSPDGEGSDAPKLTSILSRGDFDAGVGPNSQFSDDRTLARYGLLIYDPKQQAGQSLPQLIRKIAAGRTFAISKTAGKGEILFETKSFAEQSVEPRSVSYVNTDLNDFGRGNDLRESPKDLNKDFAQEMRDRLRIELDGQGVFQEFKRLGEACEAVLKTPVSHYTDRKAIPPAFKLKALRLQADQIDVSVDREDGNPPVNISFLSAGENEVFFIMLMLLNLVNNPKLGKSIILLDEPDLHIANSARELFFGQVLKAAGGSQLVVSSHSGALFRLISRNYQGPKTILKVLLRRVVNEGPPLQTELVAQYDGIYLGKVQRVHQGDWGLSPAAARISNFFVYHKARIASVLDLGSYFIWTALVGWALSSLVFALLMLGALLNDALNDLNTPEALRNILFFGHGPLQYHTATRGLLITFMIATFVPPIAVAAMRARARRAQNALLKRLRGGSDAK